MLHYNFPPFSVGEVKFLRGPGRREIGHGALAERALAPMMPAEDDFPYTVRVVSDILESNGSSSMASVCGGIAGADGRRRAAQGAGGRRGHGPGHGQATGKYAVLTDIAGAEDHYGDMDFKVAGTDDGHHRPADGHQGRRHHRRDHDARRSSRRAAGRLHILDKMQRGARRAARRRVDATRRASSPSRSRSTRSATSSDRAAR